MTDSISTVREDIRLLNQSVETIADAAKETNKALTKHLEDCHESNMKYSEQMTKLVTTVDHLAETIDKGGKDDKDLRDEVIKTRLDIVALETKMAHAWWAIYGVAAAAISGFAKAIFDMI